MVFFFNLPPNLKRAINYYPNFEVRGWRLVDKQTGEEKFILKISSRGKNSQETTKLRRKTKNVGQFFWKLYSCQ